jgi:putative acetyltransferase
LGENSVKALSRDFSISPILGEEADRLLVRSDEYMASLYPAESNHLVSSESLRAGDALFLGAFVAGEHHSSAVSTETDQSPEHELCVGCVAARFYRNQRYAEIKRLFVDEVFRGNAIARTLMSAIEKGVLAEGIDCARSEMGIFQPEAEALYLSMGYRVIPPFGDYSYDPLSQFLEKQLCSDEAEADSNR